MITRTEQDHPSFRHGTDRDYLDWLSYQPSAVDGSWNQWDTEKGCGRNIACHVRRINRGAGVGVKPPFSAIPLTDAQHRKEESFPIEWRIQQADEHLRRWIEASASAAQNAHPAPSQSCRQSLP